ncbi:MAG: PAS domain-containing protein [Candidatus Obscuribacterales bacterium]|nr:PAS domain-containing protein [Candidatus Obscuribacterales bacterium]
MNESNQGREKLLEQIRALEDELSRLRRASTDATSVLAEDGKDDQADSSCSASVFNLLNFDGIGVSHVNINGDMFEANEEFCHIIGYTKEEIESGVVRWKDITPEEFEYLDARAIQEVITEGKATPFEKQYFHKDGHRVPVLLSVTASDTTGNDCLAFALDLTLQKNAEATLKESEAQYRQLCALVPQIIWVSDKDGNIVYFNDRFYEYSGLSRDASDSEQWKQIVHPDDLDMLLHQNWKKSTLFPNGVEMEIRYRRADGAYRWHIARALPITNTRNELLMWFGTSTDIDDQKNETQILKESEVQFRTLADAIPQIVWTAEPDGSIDFFNRRWFEYTGLSVEQSLNGGWSLLIHPEDRQKYMDKWEKALSEGSTYEIEFRLKRATGLTSKRSNVYRWHLGRAVGLRDENDSIRKWFATWTEIESQKTRRGI